MRIAHLSDLHVLALDHVPLPVLLRGKRLQGYANLSLKRRHQHSIGIARRVLAHVKRMAPEHVVVTGDMSNLALDEEFEAARELLASELQGLDVTIVPGNHDAYTQESFASRGFERVFAPWQESDGPFDSSGSPPYPLVRLWEDIAVVGLSSAVPRGALVASGEVGPAQLDRLTQLLEHAELKRRALLVLVHHPVAGMHGRLHVWLRGMRDADELVRRLLTRDRVLVVHGHLHRPVFHRLAQGPHELIVSGVTSASLAGTRAGHRAGFQSLDVRDGRWAITRWEYDAERDRFDEVSVC